MLLIGQYLCFLLYMYITNKDSINQVKKVQYRNIAKYIQVKHKLCSSNLQWASMACNKGFSCSYMLLKPEEVKFVDLIHFLFSSDLDKPKFVDSSKGTEESFRRRWLIFISIIAQKFLLFVAKPMSFVGSAIEFLLNLLSSNRNLGVLLLNILRG